MALLILLSFPEEDLNKPSRDIDLEEVDILLAEAEDLGDYVVSYESREDS